MSKTTYAALLAAMLCMAGVMQAHAYESGSTGADGELVAAEDTVVDLPADGVLNYTRIQIPAGVTVSFKKNAANTPVRVLVSGDVVVAGTLDVSGSNASAVGAAGDGVTSDDGNPGLGGPGGYDGGTGGRVRPLVGDDIGAYSAEDALAVSGEWGHGPGGGAAGRLEKGRVFSYVSCDATGGNFANHNGITFSASLFGEGRTCRLAGGGDVIAAYGTGTLMPLVGGSGGGGGRAMQGVNGPGGGGGGGALLLAASGAVNITGTITADGGAAGWARRDRRYESGGGSGGAIRIIATTVSGRGSVRAMGGDGIESSDRDAADGRIRIETERMRFTGGSRPQYILGAPGELYFDGRPSVRIVSVGTQNVPANPSGSSDVTFAEAVTGDTSISLSASNVPLGTVVTVNVVPAAGAVVTASSTTLSGTLASSTASATVTLPVGPSTLQAVASFAVSATDSTAQSLYTPYTGGELVAHVSLEAGSESGMTLTTASGRKVLVPLP